MDPRGPRELLASRRRPASAGRARPVGAGGQSVPGGGDDAEPVTRTVFSMGPRTSMQDLSCFATMDISKYNDAQHNSRRLDTFHTPKKDPADLPTERGNLDTALLEATASTPKASHRQCWAARDELAQRATVLQALKDDLLPAVRRELQEAVSCLHAEIDRSLNNVVTEIRNCASAEATLLRPSLDVAAGAHGAALTEAAESWCSVADVSAALGELRRSLSRTEEALKDIRQGQALMDLTPVLKELRELHTGFDFATVIAEIRKVRTEMDMSALLAEIRKVRSEIDISQVLKEICRTRTLTEMDLSGVIAELRSLRVELRPSGRPHEARTPPVAMEVAGSGLDTEGLKVVEEFRRAEADLSQSVEEIRKEGKVLSAVLAEVDNLKLAEVSKVVKLLEDTKDAADLSVSQLVEEFRNVKALINPSRFMAEVCSIKDLMRSQQVHAKASIDSVQSSEEEVHSIKPLMSQVLEEIRGVRALVGRSQLHEDACGIRALADPSQLFEEVRDIRALVDPSQILEEVRSVRAIVDSSELLNEVRSVRALVGPTPLLEEIRGLKALLNPADLIEEVCSIKALADTSQLMEEVRSVKALVDPSQLLEEVRSVKTLVNSSPLLDEVRDAKTLADTSQLLGEVRGIKALIDPSRLLKEVHSVKSLIDPSPLLEEIRGIKALVDNSQLLEEVHGMKKLMLEEVHGVKTLVDSSRLLEEVRGVKTLIDPSRLLKELHSIKASIDPLQSLEEVRNVKAAIGHTQLLEEIHKLKDAFDHAEVLDAIHGNTQALEDIQQLSSKIELETHISKALAETDCSAILQAIDEVKSQLSFAFPGTRNLSAHSSAGTERLDRGNPELTDIDITNMSETLLGEINEEQSSRKIIGRDADVWDEPSRAHPGPQDCPLCWPRT